MSAYSDALRARAAQVERAAQALDEDMSIDAAQIIRTYTEQFAGNPLTAAPDARVMTFMMDDADNLNVDVDDLHRGMALAAERYGLSLNEFVGAIETITAYTCCDTDEAMFQLHRVVKTVEAYLGQLDEQ